MSMTGKGIGKEKSMEKGLVFACCPGRAWLQEFSCTIPGRPPDCGSKGPR